MHTHKSDNQGMSPAGAGMDVPAWYSYSMKPRKLLVFVLKIGKVIEWTLSARSYSTLLLPLFPPFIRLSNSL